MRKIVGILRPFDYKQQFFVYEDGNKIDYANVSIDEIPATMMKLIEEYDLHQIDLTGPKQYARGISKKIKEANVAKYKTDDLEINLI